MYEVEVKVPAELEAVRERLTELGADDLGAVVQEDTYYDAPHRSFPETDEALRIRVESERGGGSSSDHELGDGNADATSDGGDARLTYKGPLVDEESKTREEVETGIANAARMDAVLSNLGFEPVATVRKERERYELDGYTVTLDSVDGVGEFVEVEIEADESDLESARDGSLAILERIGLDPDDQLRTSYLELALEE